MICVLGLFIVLLLAGAVLLGCFAFRQYVRASRLVTPLAHAAKVRPGPCRKVKGKVVAVGRLLRSPLTNQECVYYRLHIDEERRTWTSGAGGGAAAALFLFGVVGGLLYAVHRLYGPGGEDRAVSSWEKVLDDAEGIQLVIEDDSGAVEVDLRDAEVIPNDRLHIHADMSRPVPSQLGDLVRKRYRVFTVDEAGRAKTMRFTEETLKAGARVTVVGPVWERRDGTPYFRQKGGALLVSERDVGKQGRSARKAALGLAAGAIGCVAVAGCLFLTALVLTVGSHLPTPYTPYRRRY